MLLIRDIRCEVHTVCFCSISTHSMKKYLTLFACTYAWLYMFPQPLDEFPVVGDVLQFWSKGIQWLTLQFGKSALGMTDLTKIEITGSGDTAFDYAKIPTLLLLAGLISAILMAVSRRFAAFPDRLVFWTRTYLRWYLALYMIIYGVAKVIEGGQFVRPDLIDFAKTYGNFSPMGLLWRFMGYSHAYATFAGGLEVAAGMLLLFRKTSVMGALLTVGVMLNVWMMNMCFDVPVKLFSFHLILFAMAYLYPNIPALWHFFVRSTPVDDAEKPLFWERKWVKWTTLGFKALLIAAVIGGSIWGNFSEREDLAEDKTPLRGIYNVESFSLNNREMPLLTNDTIRWDIIVIQDGKIQVGLRSKKFKYYQYEADSLGQKFTISSFRDSSARHEMLAQRDSNILKINGLWYGDSLRATLYRVDDSKLLLPSRGFRWINEYPFNR